MLLKVNGDTHDAGATGAPSTILCWTLPPGWIWTTTVW